MRTAELFYAKLGCVCSTRTKGYLIEAMWTKGERGYFVILCGCPLWT